MVHQFENRLTKLYAPAYKIRSIRVHGIIIFIRVCSVNQEKSCIEDASITFPMTYIIMTKEKMKEREKLGTKLETVY